MTALHASLEITPLPVITVRPDAIARELAPAFLAAAEHPMPLAGTSVEQWWRLASPGARTGLVWRIARALPHVGGAVGARLADPTWRYEAGIPLALATFVVTMRLKRQHRVENTLRAWRSDWRQWRSWCKKKALPSFNPSPAHLKAFFNVYAPAHKVSTIRRLGATLSAMHLAAGFPDPLLQPLHAEIWRDALTPPSHKMPKRKPRAAPAASTKPSGDKRDSAVDQAEGLRRDTLDRIIAAIDTTSLMGARDVALLSVLYDMLGRRAECTALRLIDVAGDNDGSATVFIQRSKTDQVGEGATLYLRPATWVAVQAWIERAQITEGLLFRSMRGFVARGTPTLLKPLGAREVARIIKRRATGAGLNEKTVGLFSGHSCRVGAAQDMAEAGLSDLDIMRAGRWKSLSMVARYTAKTRAKQTGMAKLAKTQNRHDRESPAPDTR